MLKSWRLVVIDINRTTRSRGALQKAIFVLTLIVSVSAYSAEEFFWLDIPAQLATDSLDLLAEETGSSLFIPISELENVSTGTLEGSYSLPDALDILLKDTGLNAVVTDNRVIVVSIARNIEEQQPSNEESNMNRKNKFSVRFFAAIASIFVGGTSVSYAQTDITSGETIALEEIIVTGTTAKGRTKLDSSVAITTADFETLSREAPMGTADALELIPGFWVESSGGEVSNNVAPRGLAGGASFNFIAVQEDGLPAFYDGQFADLLVRQDVTIERLEAVRGGASGILTVNGPAAITNFISRTGTEEAEGQIKFTTSDYGMIRGDYYYGAPINDEWLFSVGGYHRTSDGIRDTQFPSDQGGQFRASLTRKLDQGEMIFRFKQVNENNTFYLPIPIQGVSDPDSVPAFDASFGATQSIENSVTTIKLPSGNASSDLRDGFGIEATTAGAEFNWDFENNFSFSSNNRFTSAHIELNTHFLSGLEAGADRLDSNLATLQSAFPTVVAAQLVDTSTGNLIADPNGLNSNGLVMNLNAFYRNRKIEQFMSDNRLSHNTDRNSLTAGFLYSSYNLGRDASTSSLFLSEVRNNPGRLDIVGVDAAGAIVGQLTDNSVITHGSSFANASGDVRSYSFYVNDEYQATDDLRIDGGIRYEVASYTLSEEGNSSAEQIGALNDDGTDRDTILANNTAARVGNGIFTGFSEEYDRFAWTIGASYKLTDNFAIYVRHADAFRNPTLRRSREFRDPAVTRLDFTEFGVRYFGDSFSTSLTAFRTQFKDLRQGIEDQTTGINETVIAGTEAKGVEFEATWTPHELFSISTSGVIQDTSITDIPERAVESFLNGNSVQRTPEFQIRVTPTLHLSSVDIYAVVHHLGERYADIANDLELPSYTTIDIGAAYRVSDSLQILLKGSNLTNAIGLSEGNPRAGFSQAPVDDFYLARPILGRAYTASISYSF